MTYTFKLARRLAASRQFTMLPVFLVLAACAGDTTAPQGAAGDLPESGIYGWQPRESSPVAVRINPASVTLETNQLIQFKARGRNRAGDDIAAPVSWSTTGGTILPDGRFSAAATGTYQVMGRTRTSDDAFVVDTSTVTVVRRRVGLTSIQLSPDSVTLAPRASQAFSASGRLRTGVTVVIGVNWSATGGTIDPAGIYTAGDTAGQFRVIATNTNGKRAAVAASTFGQHADATHDSDNPGTSAARYDHRTGAGGYQHATSAAAGPSACERHTEARGVDSRHRHEQAVLCLWSNHHG
jgi:hypothetical protein